MPVATLLAVVSRTVLAFVFLTAGALKISGAVSVGDTMVRLGFRGAAWQRAGMWLPLLEIVVGVALMFPQTALAGGVAFVGLVVPHMLRPFFGHEHRRLIPAAAIAGGAYLIVCDALSRALPSTSELPLGVLTSFIGAPVFFLILLRVRRGQYV